MSQVFPYATELRLALFWAPFGVRPGHDGVTLTDDGLTFGTNADRGVCVHFRDKAPSALRRSGHSALTVTVADTEGLVAALEARPDPPAAGG